MEQAPAIPTLDALNALYDYWMEVDHAYHLALVAVYSPNATGGAVWENAVDALAAARNAERAAGDTYYQALRQYRAANP